MTTEQQTNLFATEPDEQVVANHMLAAPLAAKMRPQILDDYVGQQHILATDSPLRQAITQGHCHSLIFWGPPRRKTFQQYYQGNVNEVQLPLESCRNA